MDGIQIVPGFVIAKAAENINDSIVKILRTAGDLLPFANKAQANLLHQYEPKRDIEQHWGVLEPLTHSLRGKCEKAMDAAICFTRGEEADIKCAFCASNTGYYTVFPKCVRLPEELGDNCANSIYYHPGTISISKKEKPFDRIWSYIFKDESWIYQVLSIQYGSRGPVPCLVGSDLQKVYFGNPDGADLTLLVNDWTGDVQYSRDKFLNSLNDYEVLERDKENISIIRLKGCGIRLHITDALVDGDEGVVSIKDASKLFDLDQKESSLSTQVIYYTEDVLHTISQDLIGSVEGLSMKEKETVRHICAIKLKFRDGEPLSRLFENPERTVRVLTTTTKEEEDEWVTGFRVARPGEEERLYSIPIKQEESDA